MQLRGLFSLGGSTRSAEETSLGIDRKTVALEYTRIVEDQLARLGVPERLVRRQVVREGMRPDGRYGYSIYLSMAYWDGQLSPRLMLSQGFLEAGIWRATGASWVSEVSVLRSVWLTVGTAAQSPEAAQVLRNLVRLSEDTPPSSQSSGPRSLLQEIEPDESSGP